MYEYLFNIVFCYSLQTTSSRWTSLSYKTTCTKQHCPAIQCIQTVIRPVPSKLAKDMESDCLVKSDQEDETGLRGELGRGRQSWENKRAR